MNLKMKQIGFSVPCGQITKATAKTRDEGSGYQ